MPPASPNDIEGEPRLVLAKSISNCSTNYSRVLEIAHILHSSLVAEEIIRHFSIEISKDIALDGLIFANASENFEVHLGSIEHHTLEYTLTLHDAQLGQLQLSRETPFSQAEITTLEDFTTALVYPLHNAFIYTQALRSSFQDPLTGISNRAALEHDLERECSLARRTSTPLSLLLVDIDHFKQVNDNRGHQSGDLTLKTAAAVIRDSTRGSDMLYRYGGDEFLIILASTLADGARLVAERIRESIEAMTLHGDKDPFCITTSIGIATFDDNDDSHTLIRRTDQALYQAKHNGRNQIQLAKD